MKFNIILLTVISGSLLGACATTGSQSSKSSGEKATVSSDAQAAASLGVLAMLMSGGQGSAAEVEAIAQKAMPYPLGSKRNPVRVNMPQGQRAYLSRLNCKDGATPAFKRAGSFGAGPYGSIIDGYELTCSGQSVEGLIYMDMYHRAHAENEAVPGFTID